MISFQQVVFNCRLRGGFRTHQEMINLIRKDYPDESISAIEAEIGRTMVNPNDKKDWRYITDEEYEKLSADEKKRTIRNKSGNWLGKKYF